jgi:heparanase
MNSTAFRKFLPVTSCLVMGVIVSAAATDSTPISLAPSSTARIGTVDSRFQSYNIEMLEITGGDFWKPYTKTASAAPTPQGTQPSVPSGMNPAMYQYRPPIDLNPRLRKLAAALGPAYVRVSGT